jgi:hypothetical protein
MEHTNTRLPQRPSTRRVRGEGGLVWLLLICGLGVLVVGGAALMLGSPAGSRAEETRVGRRESSKPAEPEAAPPEEPPVPPLSPEIKLAEPPPGSVSEPENSRREVPSTLPRPPLRPGQSPTAINVLSGRVIDDVTSAPINLFTVNCIPASLGDPVTQVEQGQRSGQTFRDQQGKFRVQSLEAGSYNVVVDVPGYRRYVSTGPVQVPSSTELVVRARRGAYIEGKLLDTSGHPVANYEVNLDPKPFDPKKLIKIRQRKTDNTGYYRFGDLAPGEYRVSMGGFANADRDLVSDPIVLAEDQPYVQNFTMPLRNTLAFSITDERGVPLNAVRIRCYDRANHFNAVTDQNGETKIEHVIDSEYSLNIVCRGYKQVQEKLTVSGGATLIPVRRVLVKDKP